MASPSLVIVAGSAVTIWDCLSEAQSFTSYPQGDFHISDVAWNHNGQVLATCSAVSTDSTRHDNVVLSAAQSGAKLDTLQHNQGWKRSAGATTSVAFGGKSRYLCIGDSSGAVCLWDLKKRMRVRQFFHDEHPSNQVSLDPTDKYVLSLSDRLFSIYHLREGTLATTIHPPEKFLFTRFAISAMEPNVVAIGTTNGSILLYDISDHNSPDPFFTLERRHTGMVTGIAISPQNPQLMASTSTDGTLLFSDTQTGETIHQLASMQGAITCLCMHADGVSCAIGTESGEVILYDLRETTPLNSLRMKRPVKSIQFAPPPRNKDPNNTPIKSMSLQEQDSYDESRNPAAASREPASIVNPTSPQKSLATLATQAAHKSTITYGVPTTTSTATFGTDNAQPSVTMPPKSLATIQSETTAFTAGSLETEKAQQTAPSKPLEPPKNSYEPPKNSYEAPKNSYEAAKASYEAPKNSYEAASKSSSYDVPKTSYEAPSLDKKGGGKSVETLRTQMGIGQHSTTPAKSLDGEFQASMGVQAPATESHKERVVDPGLNLDQVRDVVRYEVDGLRDDMEEAIRNLHMDMISQFHQQSQELNSVLAAQVATIEQLTEENERLREENGRLQNGSKPSMFGR